jgi:hypothetical protein
MLKKQIIAFASIAIAVVATSCATGTPTTTVTTPSLTSFGSTYLILDWFPNYFWCDPDFYPIGNPGGELENALAQFDSIRSNYQEFTAIINRIGLDRKTDYTPEEKLLVYRQHKLLTKVLVDIQPAADGFNFVIRVGEGQGQKLTGNISTNGTLKVTKTETSFNTCPICLSKGTLIDTPNGSIPVEQLNVGDLVWTIGENGERVAAPVIKTSMTTESSFFELLKLTLEDGRVITASPGHQTVEGGFLGNLKVGDRLGGSVIEFIETVPYEGRTYDILPGGTSGLYWANGILLASTIPEPDCSC